jgi:hypothetical protein
MMKCHKKTLLPKSSKALLKTQRLISQMKCHKKNLLPESSKAPQ